MTKKKNLRKIWLVSSYLCLLLVTVKFVLGKLDTFTTICMFICYSVIALPAILRIIEIINSYRTYKAYKDGLKYLKAVHQQKYKLYFTGNKAKIEEYSAEIQRYGTDMLDVAENCISKNLLTKRHLQKIQETIEPIKNLMTDEGLR